MEFLSRNDCRCNSCNKCYIDDKFIYRCSRRKHKAIVALNPDLDTNWVVSDKEVLACKCYVYIDPINIF